MINKLKLNNRIIMKKIENNKLLLRKYSVKRIGLFGSFLKNKAKKDSDIDFIVVFNNPTFDNYIELKFSLEKMFKRKVDLVLEDSLKPSVKYVKEEALYAKAI